MAIKKVAILLTIDTSEKEEASATVRLDLPGSEHEGMGIPGADETYLVRVHDDTTPGPEGKPNKAAMLDSAAHEIGHVLSSVFKMKGGMHEDPRTLGEFHDNRWWNQASVNQANRVMTNEKLAWDIARKIRPSINEEQIKAALETYTTAQTITYLRHLGKAA